MYSLLFYAPLLLQGGFGLSPQDAGLLITPLVVFITVGSIINGRIITRIRNPNRMLYAGFLLMALSCLGIVTTHNYTAHWLIAGYMLLAGLGMGFIMPNPVSYTHLDVYKRQCADGRAGQDRRVRAADTARQAQSRHDTHPCGRCDAGRRKNGCVPI